MQVSNAKGNIHTARQQPTIMNPISTQMIMRPNPTAMQHKIQKVVRKNEP
jgi:hypothetical protein